MKEYKIRNLHSFIKSISYKCPYCKEKIRFKKAIKIITKDHIEIYGKCKKCNQMILEAFYVEHIRSE